MREIIGNNRSLYFINKKKNLKKILENDGSYKDFDQAMIDNEHTCTPLDPSLILAFTKKFLWAF